MGHLKAASQRQIFGSRGSTGSWGNFYAGRGFRRKSFNEHMLRILGVMRFMHFMQGKLKRTVPAGWKLPCEARTDIGLKQ
jgi:hypothetical protein